MDKQPSEETLFSGKTFEIIKKEMSGEGKSFFLEIARRSPGVRLIIVKGENILLTKEYRFELNGFDYRLPGGKVFDSLAAYKAALASQEDMAHLAKSAAIKECKEETGIIASDATLFHTSIAGVTIQWDLYYFIIDEFSEGAQELEEEEIIHPQWMSFAEAKRLCLSGSVSEDRSAGVLLRFLNERMS